MTTERRGSTARVQAAARASAEAAAVAASAESSERISPKQKRIALAKRWASATETITGHSLWTAAAAGDVAKVKACLAAGVDPDWADTYDGTTALWIAAKDNRAEIVQLLADAGANLHCITTGDNAWSAAEVAAYYGSVDSLKTLYSNGVDVYQDLSGNGQSPHEILWCVCACVCAYVRTCVRIMWRCCLHAASLKSASPNTRGLAKWGLV
jgi:ankyrin repeat protein